MTSPVSDFPSWKKMSELSLALRDLLPRGVRQAPPHAPYFTGYEYETLYDWDQYFDTILLGYAGYPTSLAKRGLQLFLSMQEEDGFIPRSYHPVRGVYYKHNTMFKPFLAQMALLIVQQDDDAEWLTGEIFEKLRRFFFCWRERFDVRGAGLSVWHDAGQTGMDNHDERAGNWNGTNRFCEGIDLNSYLVREGKALIVLAEILGRTTDIAALEASVDRLKKAIAEWLWDGQRGFFFDFHARDQCPIDITHVGAFAALWAEVATPVQARRMVKEHLLNEAEFWRSYPIPALAATSGGYSEGFLPGESATCCNWRANTWIPTNYFTFQGLRAYGYTDIADRLARRTLQLFERGPFSEYYTSESGIGTGLKPFWGWSGLAIYMPAEILMDANPTWLSPKNDAIFRIRSQISLH